VSRCAADAHLVQTWLRPNLQGVLGQRLLFQAKQGSFALAAFSSAERADGGEDLGRLALGSPSTPRKDTEWRPAAALACFAAAPGRPR
jgi:hypothetical protein